MLKRLLIAAMLCTAATALPRSIPNTPRVQAAKAVHYAKVKVAGVWCHVVEVDLRCPHIVVETVQAEESGYRYRTFKSMVKSYRPLAAVTGTFFDTVTGTIICNLVREGKLLAEGRVGNTIYIDTSNHAHFLPTAGTPGRNVDWSRVNFAVTCGPTLVRDGAIALNPSAEGFRDRGLFRRASRVGLGIRDDDRMLLVTVNKGVSLRRFAMMMRGLGARQAINLDGGSSTAMYVRGRFPSRPARLLTNAVMVRFRQPDPRPDEVDLPMDLLEEDGPPNVEDFHGPVPAPDVVDLDKVEVY